MHKIKGFLLLKTPLLRGFRLMWRGIMKAFPMFCY